MGVSHSWREVGAKFDRLARGVGDIPDVAVKAQVQAVKTALRAAAPSTLSGVGKKGARLGVRDTFTGRGDTAQALVYATGPWQFIEGDTHAHRIPKERGRRARRRYAVIPGVGVRAYAHHPGTRGKHIWRDTTAAAGPQLERVGGAALAAHLAAIF